MFLCNFAACVVVLGMFRIQKDFGVAWNNNMSLQIYPYFRSILISALSLIEDIAAGG
ncbi:hypothetical protein [Candidatus Endolissoclinum faulkneri]|uniref:hypothetical protein n=1 Tax=Candidatus Endolissoclinum faulkneri TaxID=1263979 RepID=UPI00042A5CF4|nr:hypothetical protein [Candidatus Endolissoclinum faulkneri]